MLTWDPVSVFPISSPPVLSATVDDLFLSFLKQSLQTHGLKIAVTVQYPLLLFFFVMFILSHIWHWEPPWAASCVLFNMTPSVFEHFLASWANKMFQVLVFVLSQTWNLTISPESHGFFSGEWYSDLGNGWYSLLLRCNGF